MERAACRDCEVDESKNRRYDAVTCNHSSNRHPYKVRRSNRDLEAPSIALACSLRYANADGVGG